MNHKKCHFSAQTASKLENSCPYPHILHLFWKERLLLWEVLAYAILDILTELKAFNWESRLFLKSHNLDQLKAMESNMSIEELQVIMRHGKKNRTINRYKGKPDNTRQSITRGESQQLYGIERHRAIATKTEQEAANRIQGSESQTTLRKRQNMEESTAIPTEEKY